MSVNHVERAYRAWAILTKRAEEKRLITYGELASLLGMHPRPIRYVLGVVQDYCLEERLPPLTIIVVSKKGVPGAGFIAHDFDRLNDGMEEVFNFPWLSLDNPFLFASEGESYTSVIKTLVNDPDASEEVYRLVKVRGVQQIIFREALLSAYREECAFTRTSFYASLEAAHIVPWQKCGPAERIDVRNGILLNSLHHKLFDRGFLTVTADYRIVFSDPNEEDGPYSQFDSLISTRLHGQKMQLPKQMTSRPLRTYLEQHHREHEFTPEELALD